MNKEQKLNRLKRDGWLVEFNPNMTIKYIATRKTITIKAKNIFNLFKQIYNY